MKPVSPRAAKIDSPDFRKIVALKEESRMVCFRAGIGEAIGEVEPRRMPTFAETFETIHSDTSDRTVHHQLLDAGDADQLIELVRDVRYGKVGPTRQDHARLKPYDWRGQSSVGGLEPLLEMRTIFLVVQY